MTVRCLLLVAAGILVPFTMAIAGTDTQRFRGTRWEPIGISMGTTAVASTRPSRTSGLFGPIRITWIIFASGIRSRVPPGISPRHHRSRLAMAMAQRTGSRHTLCSMATWHLPSRTIAAAQRLHRREAVTILADIRAPFTGRLAGGRSWLAGHSPARRWGDRVPPSLRLLERRPHVPDYAVPQDCAAGQDYAAGPRDCLLHLLALGRPAFLSEYLPG